jgi:hypothetical protein
MELLDTVWILHETIELRPDLSAFLVDLISGETLARTEMAPTTAVAPAEAAGLPDDAE